VLLRKKDKSIPHGRNLPEKLHVWNFDKKGNRLAFAKEFRKRVPVVRRKTGKKNRPVTLKT